MASEIRVNKIENRSGLGTVTFADTGVDLAGIVTATTFSGSGASLTNLPAANVTGTLPAISAANLTNIPAANVTGTLPAISGANLTNLTAGNLTGALPAISGANLTGIAATDNVRTGILDVAGIATFRSTVNVSNINDGQIGGRRNLLINGAMRVNQRVQTGTLGYFNPVTSSIYTLDRWKILNANSFDTDSAQVTQATGTTVNGFRNSIMMNIGNTETPSSNQVCGFQQLIEAQDLHSLKYGTSSAETMTLSFWVYTNKTGTYCVQLIQDDASKYVLYEYTVSASNTWEKKTITIVGNTADVIADNNGIGLYVNWILCVGSGRQVSATSSWASGGSYYATSNQVNLWDHADNYFRLTGCQLEIGTTATEYEHTTFGEELALCQRYFFQVQGDSGDRVAIGGYATHGSEARLDAVFPVTMRTNPTLSGTGSAQFDAQTDSADFNCSSLTIDSTPTGLVSGIGLQILTSGLVGGQSGGIRFREDSSTISFSADL